MKKIIITILLILIVSLTSGCTKLELKDITIEAGTKLSADVKDYINNNDINTSNLKLDTSKVDITKNGKYEYTIKKLLKTYKGNIIVEDTKKPMVEEKDVYYNVGDILDLNDFIKYYYDASGNEYEIKPYFSIDMSKMYEETEFDVAYKVIDKNGNEVGKKSRVYVTKNSELNLIKEKELNPSYHDFYNRKVDVNELYEKVECLKFDKAEKTQDPYLILPFTKDDIKEYVNKYYDNVEFNTIGIYNKYGYLIGVIFRIDENKENKTNVEYLSYEMIKNNLK